MKPEEARELVVILAAATSTRLLNDEKLVWEEQFTPLDADLATRAVMAGRNTWGRFPSWKDFKEAYNAQKRLSEAEADQRSKVPPPEPKRGVQAPEWVWVWNWLRELREPRNMIPLPQQQQPDSMSVEEYEKLRDEWVAAGSPKAKKLLPMLR